MSRDRALMAEMLTTPIRTRMVLLPLPHQMIKLYEKWGAGVVGAAARNSFRHKHDDLLSHPVVGNISNVQFYIDLVHLLYVYLDVYSRLYLKTKQKIEGIR